jgi:predicted amidophosphoribosyltransferase
MGALVHDGDTRRLVLGLKYRNARAVAAELAPAVARSVHEPGYLDVVTWAPTSARRVADRGYDPAELLARAVGQLLGLPCRRLLHRGRLSTPQSGKDRRARLVGPEFVARPLWRAPRVLLIDDVTTTGATLRAAAEALVSAGAAEVQCLAAAAAP